LTVLQLSNVFVELVEDMGAVARGKRVFITTGKRCRVVMPFGEYMWGYVEGYWERYSELRRLARGLVRGEDDIPETCARLGCEVGPAP
jgi:hypothetical protein